MAVNPQGSRQLVRKLEPLSMADQVAKEIRRSILAGELEAGRTFSLRQIADQLGVSFIPVRESLRQLETQGLIVTSPGKSAMVAPLTYEDLHGIYRLRRQIEPELAGRACASLTSADFDRLEVYVDMFADESLGIDDIWDAHRSFHQELLSPAATAWDLRTLDALWHAGERYVRLAFSGLDDLPQEHSRRREVHRDILDITRGRQPEKVADATRRHLDANEQLALRALKPIIG